jgi:DNA polymerase-3 subunit gamma/tau
VKEKEHRALYRKWRSQRFSEVIGQEHICRTLQNVLKDRRLLFHAYLFSGPRGTGKTSMARILAKALNCMEGAPHEEPCNKCVNCLKITDGSSLDVMEIDAASHTSVEMVREHIIDKVNFAPTEGKYKVYIIDEVHKLSNSSFNALLKTLEEPPPHVIFILATTHPHELLPTILSRCQRFDFRRISQGDIIRRLRSIGEEESFSVEEGALGVIAQASEGSLRDSLVILEQAASYSEGEITTERVVSLLGLTDESVLFSASQLIGEGKVSQVLHLLDEAVKEGRDLFQFILDLLEHYRRLMIAKACKDAHLMLEVPKDAYDRLVQNAGLYESGEIMRIIKVLSDLAVELRDTLNERVLVEVALIKMASKKVDPSLAALKSRLDSLEKRIFAGKIEEMDIKETVEERPRVRREAEAPPQAAEREEKKEAPKESPQGLWDLWPRILQAIKNEKMPLYAVLVDTKPYLAPDDRVVIEIRKGFTFHREQVENNKTLIATVVSGFLKKPVTVEVRVMESEDGPDDLFKVDYEEDHRKFVKDALNIFGGRII